MLDGPGRLGLELVRRRPGIDQDRLGGRWRYAVRRLIIQHSDDLGRRNWIGGPGQQFKLRKRVRQFRVRCRRLLVVIRQLLSIRRIRVRFRVDTYRQQVDGRVKLIGVFELQIGEVGLLLIGKAQSGSHADEQQAERQGQFVISVHGEVLPGVAPARSFPFRG